MKQTKLVKRAGPYYITSHSQGRGIVYFMVYPAFPQYDNSDYKWAESRYKQEGGGPSIFTSIGTAKAMEEFLNSVYPPEQVKEWGKRIKAILDDEGKSFVMVECETCGTVSCVRKEHSYCPICGKRYKKDNRKGLNAK